MKIKILLYSICGVVFVALWLAVVFALAFLNLKLSYLPLIVLVSFVYPALYQFIKKRIYKYFGKEAKE